MITQRPSTQPTFDIMLHEDSVKKASAYQQDLITGRKNPGLNFLRRLNEASVEKNLTSCVTVPSPIEIQQRRVNDHKKLENLRIMPDKLKEFVTGLSVQDFYACLSRTKQPIIYAESHVYFDGLDWTAEEFALLADITPVANVTIYANGNRDSKSRVVYEPSFPGTIAMPAGILLKHPDMPGINPDWIEVMTVSDADGDPNFRKYKDSNPYSVPVFSSLPSCIELIDFDKFYAVYIRRLLPALSKINQDAAKNNQLLILTIPGIGAGCFSGDFDTNYVKSMLIAAIHRMIVENSVHFSQFKGVFLDLFEHNQNPVEIELKTPPFKFQVLHTKQQEEFKQQLAQPKIFGDEFKECKLVNLGAGDAVSRVGNEGLAGKFDTDEAVKCICTDLAYQTTGISGKFYPKAGYKPSGKNKFSDLINGRNQKFDAYATWYVLQNAAIIPFSKFTTEHKSQESATRNSDGAPDNLSPRAAFETVQLFLLLHRKTAEFSLNEHYKLAPVKAVDENKTHYSLTLSGQSALATIEKAIARPPNCEALTRELGWCKKYYSSNDSFRFAQEIVAFREKNKNEPLVKEAFKKYESNPQEAIEMVSPLEQQRESIIKIIDNYIVSLSCCNFYGKNRALELKKDIKQYKELGALQTRVVQFIQTGKTLSDNKWYNFFRSPTKSSSIGRYSLQGMIIDHYFSQQKKSVDWLRIAFLRSTIQDEKVVKRRVMRG